MHKIRVIPRLDIKGPNLVKGIHLEGLRVLGSPKSFCNYYYENGADEFFYMDCVASLFERNSLNDLIRETAETTFIPLTVGGGLRTVEDIRRVLKAGADKVCINTAAIKRPAFIKEASEQFGSSTIVVAIEAIQKKSGEYGAFIDNGREETGKNVFDWCQELESLGAGEIVITSVDREGTGEGFDIELIKVITNLVSIPVIAHGGASSIENVIQMIKSTRVSGVAIASALHYELLTKNKVKRTVKDKSDGNTRFLDSGNSFGKIKSFDLQDLKKGLKLAGIQCR